MVRVPTTPILSNLFFISRRTFYFVLCPRGAYYLHVRLCYPWCFGESVYLMKTKKHQERLEQELRQVCRDYYREEMRERKHMQKMDRGMRDAVVVAEIRGALLEVEERYDKSYTN